MHGRIGWIAHFWVWLFALVVILPPTGKADESLVVGVLRSEAFPYAAMMTRLCKKSVLEL